MKRLWRLPAVAAAVALFTALALYDVSSAGAPTVITCDNTWTMNFSPALAVTPQNGVTAKVGDPNGALRKCTGDAAMTMGDFVAEGVGDNVTCTVGSYTNKPGTSQSVTWNAQDNQPTSAYTWNMSPIGDLLSAQTPLNGGITEGRYKDATWTMAIDALRSKIDLTDCNSPTGLKSISVAGTLVITPAS
ncbi:hypothetical protein [Streptomyces sp. NPDC051173]|uniref:hypothetical protein n=1 Tax=Streptomyces sp. NPDC051173 TaxID=3155164 RepID=UPI00344B7305